MTKLIANRTVDELAKAAPVPRKFPSLSALRSFEAAARTSSFKSAAIELNVSQAAISHQVRCLENILGLSLFQRKPRSVELTSVGELYLPYLTEAFDRIEAGTRLITRSRPEDVLTIQTYSTFAVRWLMLRLDHIKRDHPRLKLRLITSQTDPDLTDGTADISLMIGQRLSEKVQYHYLFSPTLFPVCSPAVAQSLREPKDLSKATILQVYPSRMDWLIWLHANDADEVDPESGQRFDSYDHALKMAARGFGVALGSQPYVDEDLEAGHLVAAFPGREVSAGAHWYAACLRTRADSWPVRTFVSWLMEQIARDPVLSQLRTGETSRAS